MIRVSISNKIGKQKQIKEHNTKTTKTKIKIVISSIKKLTNEMHATGTTSSASKTSIIKSTLMVASIFFSEIITSGGEDKEIFKVISSLGYFLYSWGTMNLHPAVFKRD